METCDRYAEEDGKAKALELARTFAAERGVEQRGRERFCLLLSGGFGGGKTWLASAIFRELVAGTRQAGLWRKFYQLIREIQGTYSPAARQSVDQVLGRFQKVPVLLLDDVGDLTKSEQSEDRRRLLYEILDVRNDHLLPTIITTNLGSEQLASQFGARTFERILEMAALAGFEGKNLRRES